MKKYIGLYLNYYYMCCHACTFYCFSPEIMLIHNFYLQKLYLFKVFFLLSTVVFFSHITQHNIQNITKQNIYLVFNSKITNNAMFSLYVYTHYFNRIPFLPYMHVLFYFILPVATCNFEIFHYNIIDFYHLFNFFYLFF